MLTCPHDHRSPHHRHRRRHRRDRHRPGPAARRPRRHPARQRRARPGDLLRQCRLHRHRPRAAARPAVDPEARAADADGPQRPAHRASAQHPLPAALDGPLRARRLQHDRGAQGHGFLRAADGRGQHRLEGRDPGLGAGRALQEPRRALRLRERGLVRRRAPRSASCRRPRAPSSRSSTATAPASWRPACRATSCAASTTRTACTPSIRTGW